MPTASIAKGKGYARHNDRSLDPKDPEKVTWDRELSDQNIIYKNEPIREAYDKIFGDSIKSYNESQIEKGHAERQIKSYYDKISRSKQEHTCYEIIVQIGSIKDKQGDPTTYEAIQKALDEYNRSFQKRNPNFYVIQQITHRDEKGMDHTHIMFVPYSTGNKRGLEIKNSLSGALKEMGYGRNGFDKWRESELSAMKEVMREHNLTFELGDGRQEHLNVRQYKEYKEYEAKTEHERKTLSELQKSVLEAKNNLNELESKKNDLAADIHFKRNEIENLKKKKDVIFKNPVVKVRDNPEIREALKEFSDKANTLQKEQSDDFAREYSDTGSKFVPTDELNDDMVEIKGLRKDKVEMPLSTWNLIRDGHNELVDRYKTLRDKFIERVKKVFEIFKSALNTRESVRLSEYNEYARENRSLKSKYRDAVSKYQELNKRYDKDLDSHKRLIKVLQESVRDREDIFSEAVGFIYERDLLEDFAEEKNISLNSLEDWIPEQSHERVRDWGIDR